MPSSTIHLLVAQAAAQSGAISMSGRFLLGNLAPDAVVLRPGFTKEDREGAHLRNSDWKAAWAQAREVMTLYAGDPFMVGACLHIMTDYLWLAQPYRYYKEHTPEGMTEEEARARYYLDMEALDRYLFRQNGSQNLWAAVMAARPQDFADLVTAAEADRWRKDRYAMLQQTKTMEPAQILTISVAQDFIASAGQRLGRELARLAGE